MTVMITDPIKSWQLCFEGQELDSASGDPPDPAQFQGGIRRCVLEIDYSLSDNAGTASADLVIHFYNERAATFTEGITVALERGKHNIKLDIKGRSGGLRVVNLVDATIDWLYFVVLPRETAGN